jgi:hypothetical protein
VILAGIDEAGYGPRLGPLVVAANAFRTNRQAPAGGQWPQCRFLCGPGPVRVADSKAAYSASKGLSRLETAVLGFAACHGNCPASLKGFLEAWAAEGAREALLQPWYAWGDPALPSDVDPALVPALAGAVACGLEAEGLEFLWARFCLVDEVRYNAILDRIGNKAMLLFGRNAILMRRLWDEFALEEVWLTVDRHGGRKFYGGLLDIVFPDAAIAVLSETDDESVYRLSDPGGRVMHVRFTVRAESIDSAVALSSMWAKYVRELLMRQFNDYWLARAGAVRPTAGYWVDAERFIADLRAASVISDAEVERFTRWK